MNNKNKSFLYYLLVSAKIKQIIDSLENKFILPKIVINEMRQFEWWRIQCRLRSRTNEIYI